MPASDWLQKDSVRRSVGAQNQSSGLSGLGTGEIPRPEAALNRMVDNQRRAERLIATGQYSGSDESFLSQIGKFGLDLFDKSGLDSVLHCPCPGRGVRRPVDRCGTRRRRWGR